MVIQYNLICAGVIVENIDCDLKIFENITAQRLLPAPGQQNVTALLKGIWKYLCQISGKQVTFKDV
jgi:hypothetical protein